MVMLVTLVMMITMAMMMTMLGTLVMMIMVVMMMTMLGRPAEITVAKQVNILTMLKLTMVFVRIMPIMMMVFIRILLILMVRTMMRESNEGQMQVAQVTQVIQRAC